MNDNGETLYNLLPAIYRIRDAEQGEPLKALLSVIAEQVAVLEENLLQLYDDQFIETCADWVVPYIADLIGYQGLSNNAIRAVDPRAEVANTIGYRRRKGTVMMLEQLARDVTGWNANVVEFFQVLGWTQYMNHIRIEPVRGGTADFRDYDACERIAYASGSLDSTAHSVDVRRIANRRGRYNISNIGIFLWRLNAYSITKGVARQVASGRYTLSPLGVDTQLFNNSSRKVDISRLSQEPDLPVPLRRRPLFDELEARRISILEKGSPVEVYFDDSPIFEVYINDESSPVLPEEIVICDLSSWQTPPASKNYILADGSTGTQVIRVAVDPVLGRMIFPAGVQPNSIEISYFYGFSMEVGGGEYDRTTAIPGFFLKDPNASPQPLRWQVGVSNQQSAGSQQIVKTLQEAIDDWNLQAPGCIGVIAILDSGSYDLTGIQAINIPEGSNLLIVATEWKNGNVAGEFNPDKYRPHLQGNITVNGTATDQSVNPGGFYINGLLIEGIITVNGNLNPVNLCHSTLNPGFTFDANGDPQQNEDASSLIIESLNSAVNIDSCILGGIQSGDGVQFVISNSIIDVRDETAVAFCAGDGISSGGILSVTNCTVIGKVHTRELQLASNTIFLASNSDENWRAPIWSDKRQEGCVRFSYVPPGSIVPRRYYCQPDLALANRAKILKLNSWLDLSPGEKETIKARVLPQFTSLRYGDPSYCQLDDRCAREIRQGADDQSEMGCFHNLFGPQREGNLKTRLKEYLRFELEAGIFHST